MDNHDQSAGLEWLETSNEKVQNEDGVRKRKLTEKSDELSPNSDNNTMFPLFCKKVGDIKDTKNNKEQQDKESARKLINKSKKKKAKTDKDKTAKEDNASGLVEKLLSESDANLQVLDIRTVIKCLNSVKQNMESQQKIQEEQMKKFEVRCKSDVTKQMMETKDRVIKDIEASVQRSFEFYEDKIQKLEKDLNYQKSQAAIMTGVIQRNHQVIQDLSGRLGNLELNNAKKSIVVTVIEFSDKKRERISQVKEFLEETFDITVALEDCYKIGPESTVVVLETAGLKAHIFERKSELSSMEGTGGRDIYINDYLPAATNEKKTKRKRY